MVAKRKRESSSDEDQTREGKRSVVVGEVGSTLGGSVIRHFLVCTTGGSDKFYELSVSDELTVQCRYGRQGTAGTVTEKSFAFAHEVEAFLSKMLKEKLQKGYRRVESNPLSDRVDAPMISVPMSEAVLNDFSVTTSAPERSRQQSQQDCLSAYLECTINGALKFYQITHKDDKAFLRYGRIGTTGAKMTKTFPSVVAMRAYCSEQVEKKLQSGYVYATAPAGAVISTDVTVSTAGDTRKHTVEEVIESTQEDVELTVHVSKSKPIALSQTVSEPSNSQRFYLECVEGSSSKFYEIVLANCDVTLRYGRIGASGTSSTKSFKTLAEAQKFAEKTMLEKRVKGYRLIPTTETVNDVVSEAPVPREDVVATVVRFEDCADASAALEAGKTVLVSGSGALPYKVKKFVGGYSCSCPGWIFSIKGKGTQGASCKHLRLIRGDAEDQRTQSNSSNTTAATGDKMSSITSKIALAQQWKPTINPAGLLMSEKLDGMRAYYTKHKLWTRNGNEIIAPKWFLEGLPDKEDLDGELFLGRKQFEDCMSIARRTDASDDWRSLRYVVFDCPTAKGGLSQRLLRAQQLLSEEKTPFAVLHPHSVCEGEEQLMDELARIEALGGEGLMLRSATAAHRGGRTSDLLKVKSFLDDEALVVDHEEGKGKYAGLVGSLICVSKQGRRFKIGSGLSDDMRSARLVPKKGAVVTFKYFELTKDGVPRFPTFLRVRPDVDANVFSSVS